MVRKTKQEILKEVMEKDKQKKEKEERKKAMDIQRDMIKKKIQKDELEKKFWGEDGVTYHLE